MCSTGICQFGLAHVDSPKGDLDASSGSLYSPEALTSPSNAVAGTSRVATPVIVGDAMYPQGTYELYPQMIDTSNNILADTGHGYMECSNKGLCDRSAGVCNCFQGYDGSACQRASCPSSSAGFCSGHGMCYTAKEIARQDNNNTYMLWDQYSSMGCICDPGFSGADCSEMMCKFGADPLYYDDQVNMRYSNFTFALYAVDKTDATKDAITATTTNSARSALWKGNYSIVFFDHFGQPWKTGPIDIGANCLDIRTALESLPNNVIPAGTVRCSMDYGAKGTYVVNGESSVGGSAGQPVTAGADGYPIALDAAYAIATTFYPFTGLKFTLAFPGNPGYLKQPYIDLNLDGSRPTLVTGYSKGATAASYNIGQWVYPNGYAGEDEDYVPDLCQGVTVTLVSGPTTNNQLASASNWGQFGGLDAKETPLLMACLGDSDGNPNNNNMNKLTNSQDALYNWDYGIQISAAPTTAPNVDVTSTSYSAYSQNYLVNPHLVKLVDTTTFAETRLCNQMNIQYTGVNQITMPGYCSNINPPGFYLVVFYAPGANGGFNFLSNAFADYQSTPNTNFYVFTTTGYLNLASWTTEVFTQYYDAGLSLALEAGALLDLGSLYSNVVYTYFLTVPTAGATTSTGESPNVDCETYGMMNSVVAGSKTHDCIQKGDTVMIFETAGVKTNPKYMNLYTVMRISRENREAVRDVAAVNKAISQEVLRYQIVLDMGMNARYIKTSSGASNARIFKFYPPQNTVQYVDECSMRGICDKTAGVCNCFAGYTGDNCAVMNALAT